MKNALEFVQEHTYIIHSIPKNIKHTKINCRNVRTDQTDYLHVIKVKNTSIYRANKSSQSSTSVFVDYVKPIKNTNFGVF